VKSVCLVERWSVVEMLVDVLAAFVIFCCATDTQVADVSLFLVGKLP
jgi:hypothetical protein